MLASEAGLLLKLLHFLTGGVHVSHLCLFCFVHLPLMHGVEYRKLVCGAFGHVGKEQVAKVWAGSLGYAACVILYKVFFLGQKVTQQFLLVHARMV